MLRSSDFKRPLPELQEINSFSSIKTKKNGTRKKTLSTLYLNQFLTKVTIFAHGNFLRCLAIQVKSFRFSMPHFDNRFNHSSPVD